jgi:hypothetical protein
VLYQQTGLKIMHKGMFTLDFIFFFPIYLFDIFKELIEDFFLKINTKAVINYMKYNRRTILYKNP